MALPVVDSPSSLRSAVESIPALYLQLAELDNAAPQSRLHRAWRLWRPDNERLARVDAHVSDPDWSPDPSRQRDRGEPDHLLAPIGYRGRVSRFGFKTGDPVAAALPAPDGPPVWRMDFAAPRVSSLYDARRGPFDGWRYWPVLHDPIEALLWSDGHDGTKWRDLSNALVGPALVYWSAFAGALERDIALEPPDGLAVDMDELTAVNAMTGDQVPAGELIPARGGSPAASTAALPPTKGRPTWH